MFAPVLRNTRLRGLDGGGILDRGEKTRIHGFNKRPQ
jgi:hypothetical protein